MKETFIIIGEGPTEYFFLTSLKDEFRTLQNIAPQYPKHTSMVELELKIKKAIEQGYNHVYCMIDLDNKKEGKEKTDYVNLKKKYHGKHISKPKKGIDCHIEFFETERCTELFFLYYFKYTTKLYSHSNEVEVLQQASSPPVLHATGRLDLLCNLKCREVYDLLPFRNP